MRSASLPTVILALSLAPLSCGRPQPIAGAVHQANQRFVEAFSRGDAAAIAALFTEDAVVLPPDNPMVSGSKAIQGFLTGLLTAGARRLSLDTLDVHETADGAIERGAFSLTMQPEGRPASELEGKYVVIWKRQPDGSCKLAVDIFNFNGPKAASSPAPFPAPAP